MYKRQVYRSALEKVAKAVDSGNYVAKDAVKKVDSDNPVLENTSENKVEAGNAGLLGYCYRLFKKLFNM